jgi:hypothetical protein
MATPRRFLLPISRLVMAGLRHAAVRRIAIATGVLVAAQSGCSPSSLVFPPGPSVLGVAWDSLAVDSCRGNVHNDGGTAFNTRIQLWYATGQTETAQVVIPSPADIPTSSRHAVFVARSQVTNGEPRFPRRGTVSWDGGSIPEEPRAPLVAFGMPGYGTWCWRAPDSVSALVTSTGGWAYHVVLTLETRDGVRDVSPKPDRFGPRGGGSFYSVARESMGVFLLPRVIKMRWEDYGGIRDSVVSPLVSYESSRCY